MTEVIYYPLAIAVLIGVLSIVYKPYLKETKIFDWAATKYHGLYAVFTRRKNLLRSSASSV